MNTEVTATNDAAENALTADESTDVVNELETDLEDTDHGDEVESDDSEDGEGSDKDGDVKDDAKKAHRNGFKKRLDREKRKLAEKDQEIDFWRKEALKRTSDQKTTDTSKQVTEDKEPNPEDFDTNADYIRACTRWEAKQAAKEAKQEFEKAKLAEKSQHQMADYNKKVTEFASKTSDFDDVVSEFTEQHGPLQATQRIWDAIRNSEFGAQIPYEIMKTPGEYERLSKMSEDQIIWEIAKRDARIALKSESNKQIIKTSKAPAPASPVGGRGGSSGKKSIYDKDISFAAYEKLRNEQNK